MARQRGSGSVYQDKHGQWWAKVPIGNGKNARARAADRKDAEAKRRAFVAKRDAGLNIAGGAQSVQQFLSMWLQTYAAERVKPTTLAFYQLCCEYAIAHIGRIRLEDLQPEHITTMQTALKKDLSARTVMHVRSVLRTALNVARRWHYIASNPASDVDPLPVPTAPQVALTVAQARALLETVDGHRLSALYHVALLLGLRKGELLGLRWADLDLERGRLTVAQQIVAIKGKVQASTPKSATSHRTLPLTPELARRLRDHWQNQQEERALLGTAWQEHGLVFASEVGTPISPRNLSRHFKRMLHAAGLPARVRFHDLRHTAASLLREIGADPRTAQGLLGHSDVTLTLGTYTHTNEDAMRAALEQVQRRVG